MEAPIMVRRQSKMEEPIASARFGDLGSSLLPGRCTRDLAAPVSRTPCQDLGRFALTPRRTSRYNDSDYRSLHVGTTRLGTA